MIERKGAAVLRPEDVAPLTEQEEAKAAEIIAELNERLKKPDDVTFDGKDVEQRTVCVVGNRLKLAGWDVQRMGQVKLWIRHPDTTLPERRAGEGSGAG